MTSVLLLGVLGCTDAGTAYRLSNLVSSVEVSTQKPDGSWSEAAKFATFAEAQASALKVAAWRAKYAVDFELPATACQDGELGVYLDFVYDQDATRLNGRLIGVTGDPSDQKLSPRRLSLIPRVYPLPRDVLVCGGKNRLEMDVRRILGGWLGPNFALAQIGSIGTMEALAFRAEALTPLLHRDIGVCLLAISMVLLGLFWRYPDNAKQKTLVSFAVAVGLLCLSLSGWFYRYSDHPMVNFRMHVVLIWLAITMQIRFVASYRGVARVDRIPNFAMLVGAAALYAAVAFSIAGPALLLKLYMYWLVSLTVVSAILWMGPLFRIRGLAWGRSLVSEVALFAIHFGVFWDVTRIWQLHSFENISPYTFGISTVIIAIAAASELTNVFRKAAESAQLEAKAREMTIVAQTTQMLAHDVRKPFSIFKMGLAMLDATGDPTQKGEVTAKLKQEIDRAVRSVDGLIQDVMEVGSTSTMLTLESVEVATLIQTSIGEVFRLYPHAEVTMTYDLAHRRCVSVDAVKMDRVLSNVVGNAVQAMGSKGELWFKSRDDGRFVELCIGNGGSFVSEEERPFIFDVFYTKGKKGGTGLGLAIARKIVVGHGGTIRCESGKNDRHPAGWVEFWFTLPSTEAASFPAASLPSHSRQIVQPLVFGELTSSAASGLPQVVLVEDSIFVTEAWQHVLAGQVVLHVFNGPAALHARLKQEPSFLDAVELVITDFHFDNEDETGAEVAQLVKARRAKLPVFLSSDSSFSPIGQVAGVDKIISKQPVAYRLLVGRD